VAKQAIEGTRLNAFGVDPSSLILVGLDTDEGPEHPLYDERVFLNPDEALVKNVMVYGVIEPVLVHKDPDGRVLVVAGRQRVRAAREANRRLAREGKAELLIPVMTRRGEQNSLMGIMVSENEHRFGDQPLVKARKASRFLGMGHSEAEAAVAFGVSIQTLHAWLRLLELDPALVKAVERGEVSASQALESAGAGSEAQRLLAEEAKDKGPAKKGRPKAQNGRPTKVKIEKMCDSLKAVKRLSREAKALRWVLGQITDDELTG
jgi:ParB family chromosome partitioning protein